MDGSVGWIMSLCEATVNVAVWQLQRKLLTACTFSWYCFLRVGCYSDGITRALWQQSANVICLRAGYLTCYGFRGIHFKYTCTFA